MHGLGYKHKFPFFTVNLLKLNNQCINDFQTQGQRYLLLKEIEGKTDWIAKVGGSLQWDPVNKSMFIVFCKIALRHIYGKL